MRTTRFLTIAASILSIGCASSPDKVPVLGYSASIQGTWQGEFKSSVTGRNGFIHFNLKEGQDTAYGDVMIVSEEWQNRGSRYWGEMPGTPKLQQPALLNISFVHVSDVMVRGVMEPYRDVSCDCTVRIVFEGTVAWDVIEGTYQARYSTGALAYEGTWRVKRASFDSTAGVDGR